MAMEAMESRKRPNNCLSSYRISKIWAPSSPTDTASQLPRRDTIASSPTKLLSHFLVDQSLDIRTSQESDRLLSHAGWLFRSEEVIHVGGRDPSIGPLDNGSTVGAIGVGLPLPSFQ